MMRHFLFTLLGQRCANIAIIINLQISLNLLQTAAFLGVSYCTLILHTYARLWCTVCAFDVSAGWPYMQCSVHHSERALKIPMAVADTKTEQESEFAFTLMLGAMIFGC